MRRSWLNLILLPAVMLGLIITPFLLFWSDLPSPMASHWGLNGDPDASMPPFLLMLLLAGLFVAVLFAVRRVLRHAPEEGPSFVAGLLAIGTVLAGVGWMSVVANRNAASWDQADEVGLLAIVGLLGAALVVGFLSWVFAGGGSAARSALGAVVSSDAPVLDVADPSHSVWSSRGIGRVTLVIGAVVILMGIAMWGLAAVALVLVGLVALLFAEVRATVSPKGVLVSLGWWGFPMWTVPLSGIARAETEDVRPMAYGGYGYRMRPGVRAVVVRGGDSLRIVRRNKADLVLTVDDAETGAGLINAMLGASAI